MAFCSNCGAALREGANFCEGCGSGTSGIVQSRRGTSTSSHRLSMATLYADWKTVLLKPKLFFGELANRQRNLTAPSAFIGLLWVLLMALLLIFGIMTGSSRITEAPGFIFAVAAATILFVIPAMFLTAAFYHVFVKLFGGTGSYADTYNVIAYSMAVMPFSILIIPGWYAVYLVHVGFLKLHSMSPRQAIGAIIAPIVISLIIIAILIAAMYSFLLGTLGQLDSKQEQTASSSNKNTQSIAEKKIRLAKQYESAGELDKAIAECREAVKIVPSISYYRVMLGRLLIDQAIRTQRSGLLEDAIRISEEGLAYERNNSELCANAGKAYLTLGKVQDDGSAKSKGADYLRRALELDPRNKDLQLAVEALESTKALDVDSEISALLNKLINNPKDYTLMEEIGDAYSDKADFEQAARYYRNALEYDSGNHKVWTSLGSAYYRLGNNNEALASFKKATNLDSKDSMAWYNLGVIYHLMKDRTNTINSWEKYLSLESNSEKADSIKIEVDRLKEGGSF